MGKDAIEEINDNGERLLSYCNSNKFKIGGRLFNTTKFMLAPNGKTVNQKDHICDQRRWASSFQDVRVYRGTDIGSDHYMVVAAMKVKLKSSAKRMKHTILDMAKLKNKRTKDQLCLELKNRFSVLEQQEDNEQNVEEDWKEIKI